MPVQDKPELGKQYHVEFRELPENGFTATLVQNFGSTAEWLLEGGVLMTLSWRSIENVTPVANLDRTRTPDNS